MRSSSEMEIRNTRKNPINNPINHSNLIWNSIYKLNGSVVLKWKLWNAITSAKLRQRRDADSRASPSLSRYAPSRALESFAGCAQ